MPLIQLQMHPQPDDVTCGPTSLHAVYRHYGLDLPLEQVIAEVPQLDHGGTLEVHLACHALRQGFRARMHVFNVLMFDPTWFRGPGGLADPELLAAKLRAQREAKPRKHFRTAIDAYLEYLRLGGELAMEDLTPELLRRYLNRGLPILTGLSATYLYGCAREIPAGPGRLAPDDVRGEPTGHFVVLAHYDRETRTVLVADPLPPSCDPPERPGANRMRAVDIHRLVCAILLGVITYDGNLLVIRPAAATGGGASAASARPAPAPRARPAEGVRRPA